MVRVYLKTKQRKHYILYLYMILFYWFHLQSHFLFQRKIVNWLVFTCTENLDFTHKNTCFLFFFPLNIVFLCFLCVFFRFFPLLCYILLLFCLYFAFEPIVSKCEMKKSKTKKPKQGSQYKIDSSRLICMLAEWMLHIPLEN